MWTPALPHFGLCLTMLAHPHTDVLLILLRMWHITFSPPFSLPLCALTSHIGLTLGGCLPHPASVLTLSPRSPSQMNTLQTLPGVWHPCHASPLRGYGLCLSMPDFSPGWGMIFLHYQPDCITLLYKIFPSFLLPSW